MEKSKQISVEIDGVTYTPVFNLNSMAKFTDKYGLTIENLTQLPNLRIRQLLDLVFFGIEEYCRIFRKECPFDVYRIGELDSDTISKLFASIASNMMQFPKV